MEAGAAVAKVKEIVAAVTKDNSEVTIIMAIMTVVVDIAISIMEVVVDRMEDEEDLVAATTEEAQQSEEVVEVEEAEEMVVTTQLDMIIAAETITTPKNPSNVETKRIHWISFMSCE